MLQTTILKSSAQNYRLMLVLGIIKNSTKRLIEYNSQFTFNTHSPCFLRRPELRSFPISQSLGYPNFLSLNIFPEQAVYLGQCVASLPGQRA